MRELPFLLLIALGFFILRFIAKHMKEEEFDYKAYENRNTIADMAEKNTLPKYDFKEYAIKNKDLSTTFVEIVRDKNKNVVGKKVENSMHNQKNIDIYPEGEFDCSEEGDMYK